MGLAVQHDKYVTFYDIVVGADACGQRLGSAIMNSLLHWATQSGITQAALVVDGENQIANAMYDKLGFETHYEYWYWKKV